MNGLPIVGLLDEKPEIKVTITNPQREHFIFVNW
jgi:hypothetical protein